MVLFISNNYNAYLQFLKDHPTWPQGMVRYTKPSLLVRLIPRTRPCWYVNPELRNSDALEESGFLELTDERGLNSSGIPPFGGF